MSIYPNPMTAGQEPTPPDAEPGRTRADDGVGVRPAEIGRRPARTQDPIESEGDAMIIATDGSNSPRRARRGGPIGRGTAARTGPFRRSDRGTCKRPKLEAIRQFLTGRSRSRRRSDGTRIAGGRIGSTPSPIFAST